MSAGFVVSPGEDLAGTIRVPGDKSISHRALMLGGLADGPVTVTGWLDGADCRATRQAMTALGVRFESGTADTLTVIPPPHLTPPVGVLDLGNSGTGIRLLSGLLAGLGLSATLDGDESIRRRPYGASRRAAAGDGCRA